MTGGVPGLAALSNDPTPELVRDLLRGVIDPELRVDIVELGLLRGVRCALASPVSASR